MMTSPACPSSRDRICANFIPAPDALREPTTPIIGRISVARSPLTASSGGASSIVARCGGYPLSPGATKRTPSLNAFAISRSASSREQMRPMRCAPPRRARSGSRRSAALALPA
jgi:hypothetical protein